LVLDPMPFSAARDAVSLKLYLSGPSPPPSQCDRFPTSCAVSGGCRRRRARLRSQTDYTA